MEETTEEINFLDPAQCERFIKRGFADTPQRLRHILVIADRVRQTARDLNELGTAGRIDETFAYCAALVHDIGYLPDAHSSGFHPLDGHDYLQKRGFSLLATTILGHSSSPEEAKLLGFENIEPSDSIVAQLITYWDMQVKQGGEIVTYKERVEDIQHRYGQDSIVTEAHLLAKPRIEQLILSIDRLLGRVPM